MENTQDDEAYVLTWTRCMPRDEQPDTPATKTDVRALSQLIEHVAESLSREIQHLGARFDAQSARLDRHSGLLRGGGMQIARLVEWSEKVDAQIEELTAR